MNTDFYWQYREELKNFITSALKEDIGEADHTSLACIDVAQIQKAVLRTKETCVIAGVTLAEAIFKQYDPKMEVSTSVHDGEQVHSGDVILRVEGNAQSLLATERLVLNCMQRMSGITTLTHRLAKKIAHTNCTLLDTRKTTPNFRYPEKWAVAIGGGVNHRMGLFDALMLKDNHIDYCGGVRQALEKTASYLKRLGQELPVIVETRNLLEVEEVLQFPWISRILLDNMPPAMLREAVELIDGKITTEASGNINESNIVAIAETGVNCISMGALTHSAPAVDLHLKAQE